MDFTNSLYKIGGVANLIGFKNYNERVAVVAGH